MQLKESPQELRNQLTGLYVDLVQVVGSVPVQTMEALCRKIHGIEFKLYSFKGGRYGKRKLQSDY